MPSEWFEWPALLWRLIALGIVVVVFLTRTLWARAAIRLALARLRTRDPARFALVRTALLRPLSWFFLTGTIRGVLPLLALTPSCFGVVSNVFSTLFLLAAFWVLYASAGLVAGLLLDTSRPATGKIDANAANYITVACKAVVIVFGIFAILSRWVSDITGMLAGLGIGGLALALAAQDTAANLFGSIAIMVDKPFEIGDWIEFEQYAGTVVAVGLRSTKIRILDQSLLSVPNSRLAAGIIANGASRAARRVSFHVGLAYHTSPEQIDALVAQIRELLRTDPEVRPGSGMVAFERFSASSLDVFVAYQTHKEYQEMLRVRQRINLAILQQARELGVILALPAISLHRDREEKAGDAIEGFSNT